MGLKEDVQGNGGGGDAISMSQRSFQGWMTLRSNKSYSTHSVIIESRERLYFILDETSLSYYKSTEATEPAMGRIILTGDSSVRRQGAMSPATTNSTNSGSGPTHQEAPSSPLHRPQNMIVLKTPTTEICCQGEDFAEESKWIEHLQEVIDALRLKGDREQHTVDPELVGPIQQPEEASLPQPPAVPSPPPPPPPASNSSFNHDEKRAIMQQQQQQPQPTQQIPESQQQHQQPTPWGVTGIGAAGGAAAGATTILLTTPTLLPIVDQINNALLPSRAEGNEASDLQAQQQQQGQKSVSFDGSNSRRISDKLDKRDSRRDSLEVTGNLPPPSTPVTAAVEDGDDDQIKGWVKMSRRKYYMVLKDAKNLDLYTSLVDYTENKPARETISLTTDMLVESRKLPLRAKAPPPSTPDSPYLYTESYEPDSVIELRLPGKGGNTKTITLQCLSVEEENRWISNLQIAVGSLTAPISNNPTGGAEGSGGGGILPRQCLPACTIS